MKSKSTKTKLHKHVKARVRQDTKEQGYYDGRYHTRAVPDKKKKQNKEAARKFKEEGEKGES